MRLVPRKLIYSLPLLRNHANKQDRDPEWWNEQMAGPRASYLGGTVSIDIRNAVTATLVKHYAPTNPSVLDLGCAAGGLAHVLNASHYIGIDMSSYAIDCAKTAFNGSHSIEFAISDLCSYTPSGQFDLIVFNEVLYCLGVDTAIAEVSRYAESLTASGLLIVSMKNAPKSQAIIKRLARRFAWRESALVQCNTEGPSYSIRTNRERPAYLITTMARLS